MVKSVVLQVINLFIARTTSRRPSQIASYIGVGRQRWSIERVRDNSVALLQMLT